MNKPMSPAVAAFVLASFHAQDLGARLNRTEAVACGNNAVSLGAWLASPERAAFKALAARAEHARGAARVCTRNLMLASLR